MSLHSLALACPDGQRIQASLFVPEAAPRGHILIAPALAVAQTFYYPLAQYLCQHGFRVLTLDYRGVGASELTIPSPADVSLVHWAEQDLAVALAALTETADDAPVYWIGHSFGGQALALVPGHERVDGAITVGSSVPYWRHYGRRALPMWAFWHLLAPLLSIGERFPARRLGLGRRDLPSGIVRQWARWGRRRDYLFCASQGLPLLAYQAFDRPVRHYGFADDHYAPPAAVEDLASRYGSDQSELRLVSADTLKAWGGVGHFSGFTERHRDTLWPEWLDYLESLLAASSQR
ncbi:alpha/beta fold hydrolase [Halomonas denitrificans]|nr:alpha/beta fold hydrolase [Halomonas denitrificans]